MQILKQKFQREIFKLSFQKLILSFKKSIDFQPLKYIALSGKKFKAQDASIDWILKFKEKFFRTGKRKNIEINFGALCILYFNTKVHIFYAFYTNIIACSQQYKRNSKLHSYFHSYFEFKFYLYNFIENAWYWHILKKGLHLVFLNNFTIFLYMDFLFRKYYLISNKSQILTSDYMM